GAPQRLREAAASARGRSPDAAAALRQREPRGGAAPAEGRGHRPRGRGRGPYHLPPGWGVERGLPYGYTPRNGRVGAAGPRTPWGRYLKSPLVGFPGPRARAGSGRADPGAVHPPAWERRAQGAEPAEDGGVLAAPPETCVSGRRAVGATLRLRTRTGRRAHHVVPGGAQVRRRGRAAPRTRVRAPRARGTGGRLHPARSLRAPAPAPLRGPGVAGTRRRRCLRGRCHASGNREGARAGGLAGGGKAPAALGLRGRVNESACVCSGSSTSRTLVPALGCLGSRQKHSLPDLPYDYGALEPHINAQIMQLHHSKHHAAYVNNLNTIEEKYLEALEKGELLEAIKRDFGSFDKFKEKLTTVSVGVQGSGWGWLGFNKEQGRLQIAACFNQDPLQGTTGLIPLLGIDVWEHAYYLQYKNVRPDYLKAIWNVINWENVTERYMACKK
uniref:superoxide dismutase n=1 Tax=Canis lupus familiaris TaxID=9615 RepID=A0A8C0TMX2_CANLF